MSTNDIVREMVALPEVQYRSAVDHFLDERQPQFAAIAKRLTRGYLNVRDDAKAIVMTECWQMISATREDPTYLDAVRTFEAILMFKARKTIRALIDSTAPGGTAVQRRWRHVQETREAFVNDHLREPEPAELIDEANRVMAQRRSDPARQGMIITRDDLHHPAHRNPEIDAIAGEAGWEEMNAQACAAADTDYLIHPDEGRQLVADVVKRLDSEDVPVGRLWLFEAMGSNRPPANDTVRWIADQLGTDIPSVTGSVARIKSVAAEILSEAADRCA